MSFLSEIINGLGGIILSLLNIYIWVVIISALLSFVKPDPYNPIVKFLNGITLPAYAFVRRYIRTNFNGLDLAPLIIIVALQIIIILFSAVLHRI